MRCAVEGCKDGKVSANSHLGNAAIAATPHPTRLTPGHLLLKEKALGCAINDPVLSAVFGR